MGDYLFQALQKPDPGHRASARDGGSDAGKRPLPRLLPGNDLCGLLAGANLQEGDPDVLLRALSSSFKFLPDNQRQAFLQIVNEQIQ